MHIDPARLSRLLLMLSRPSGSRTARTDEKRTASTAPTPPSDNQRQISALRSALRNRLRSLPESAPDYDADAALMTIQEILVWEFGREILDHPDFHRVATSVTDTMRQNSRMAASLSRLARRLANAEE